MKQNMSARAMMRITIVGGLLMIALSAIVVGAAAAIAGLAG